MNNWYRVLTGFLAGLLIQAAIGCGSEMTAEEHRQAGQKAFLESDYKEARKEFLLALKASPSDKDILYYIGMSFKRDYILDSALFYFKRSDILYPNQREVNKEILEIAVQVENWDYALAAMSGLVGAGDPIEDYYDDYAEMWAKNEHPANAYFFIKKAIEVNPDERILYLQAANLASIVEPGPEAVKWIDTAIAKFGEDGVLLTNKALMLSRQEKYTEAEKIYRKLFASDTTSAPARVNLGNVLASQSSKKKKREALMHFRKANETASEQIKAAFKLDSIIAELEEELSQ